jgi:hypothetical protein
MQKIGRRTVEEIERGRRASVKGRACQTPEREGRKGEIGAIGETVKREGGT